MAYNPQPTKAVADFNHASSVDGSYTSVGLDGAGNAVSWTLSLVQGWLQSVLPSLFNKTLPIVLPAGTVTLDASVHDRHDLIVTAATTLVVGNFTNLGPSFKCTVIPDGAGVATLGTGITSSLPSISAGQSTTLTAYNNGTTNVLFSSASIAPSTTPAITISGPGGSQSIPVGSTTVAVPITVALVNFSTTPSSTLQINVDGGGYTALPGGVTITNTAVTGLTVTVAAGSHTVVLRDTGTGAISNSITVVAAASSSTNIAPPGGSVTVGSYIFKSITPASAGITHGTNVGVTFTVTRATGTTTHGPYDQGENGYPAGVDPLNGDTPGFSTLTFGWNTTATGNASSAPFNKVPSNNSSGTFIGVYPGAYNWLINYFGGTPNVGTYYAVVTTGDGVTAYFGPYTAT